MSLDGLDLTERCALLGVTGRQLVKLAQRDPRMFATPTTEASIARLRRWIEAGQPVADVSRLAFTGADSVRAIVAEVLASLPAPIAWHGVEHVTWIEVGRNARGWQSFARRSRAPVHDTEHVIALAGTMPDGELRGVVAHELGHSVHRSVWPSLAHVPMAEHEQLARQIVVARDRGLDLGQLAHELAHEESLADRQAIAWGFDRPSNHEHLVTHFRAQLDAAAGLADEIARRLNEECPMPEARAAACLNEETP